MTRPTDTTFKNEQNIPTLSKTGTINTFERPYNQMTTVDGPAAGNLIDFLEDSWKKTQVSG